MVNRVYSNRISEYAHENGGRVIILFLLFCLLIYEFLHSGFSTFAIICISPLLIIAVYTSFKLRMGAFWALIFINYILQMKDSPLPGGIPMSLWDEMIELLLILMAIVDLRQKPHFERCLNLMLFGVLLWLGFCVLQLFNNTCDLGIDVSAWFTSFRLIALQLLWIVIVFCLYISSPKALLNYLRLF